MQIYSINFNAIQRQKIAATNTPKNLVLETHGHEQWLRWFWRSDHETSEVGDKEELSDVPSMSPLEGDKEAKEQGLKISTPKQILTRLPVLSAQIKAGNNSYKLKN